MYTIYELHETTVQSRGCEVGLALSMHVSTGDRVRTDDWWFHDDDDDGFFRFVRLSVSLSVALSVARDQRALSPISPSLFASFGALLVLVFMCVGVYHRVGAWVGVGEDGGIGQETNDRHPRYPGGSTRLVVGVPTYLPLAIKRSSPSRLFTCGQTHKQKGRILRAGR
jgi:hypothetical protein